MLMVKEEKMDRNKELREYQRNLMKLSGDKIYPLGPETKRYRYRRDRTFTGNLGDSFFGTVMDANLSKDKTMINVKLK